MNLASQTVDHLFRAEYGKLVAHLTAILGTEHLELAEEAMQEAMCRAVESWPLKGTPENPSGWLVRVARNHALDRLRRRSNFRSKREAVTHLIASLSAINTEREDLDEAVRDDQLRMMFSCCHPSLPSPVQVAIMLKVLCGFSVAEIASAFLASVAAIEKRIARGKRSLRQARALMEIGPRQVAERLEGVCQTLYLLFNEGYLSGHHDGIRDELCFEAMRLTTLLVSTPAADRPMARALLALMCFHSARLPARRDGAGDLVLLMDQDRGRWDTRLIAQGFAALQSSDPQHHLSSFHIEAMLSAKHVLAQRPEETDWPGVLELYAKLLELKPSPVVRVNLAIATARVHGEAAGLALLMEASAERALRDYHYYYATMGQLLAESGQLDGAREAFRRALKLCRNDTEARCLQAKLDRLPG